MNVAAIVTGTATVVLAMVVAVRALAGFKRGLRRTLIAEASAEEYSADLMMWEDEIQEARNDAQP